MLFHSQVFIKDFPKMLSGQLCLKENGRTIYLEHLLKENGRTPLNGWF